MITYGSYMPERSFVVRDGLAVALLDTVLALLAGSVIFAVVFAHGKEAAAGPGLVFVTLPDLFTDMPGGGVVAVAFFFMLIFAAWSSAISLLEVVVSWLVDAMKVPRTIGTVGAGFAIWLLGLACAAGAGMPGFDQSVFDFFDNVTTKYLLPAGGLLVALIAGWVVKTSDSLSGFEAIGSSRLGVLWLWTIRVVTPILVLLVLLNGVGVFG
jgi:NSS family neurotransmitter:Na+ symporter